LRRLCRRTCVVVSAFQRVKMLRPLLLPAMRAGAARVPRTLRAAAATMRFDTANAYYDIAFAVPGVKT